LAVNLYRDRCRLRPAIMCGIAGFTRRDKGSPGNGQAVLEAMLGAIAYRGPDQHGFELNQKFGFAHNRLTIMEPLGGRQPRVHPESGNALIYNGEIYGYRAFDADIHAAGHGFRDHCDTETLFWLIEMHGVRRACSMLDGMFAFAFYATATDTMYLARDRFGQKPLFYANVNGELIFASEIKALLRHPSLAKPAPDTDALSLYLMMEYVPGNATGIQNIQQLAPGHVLTFANGRISIEPYWSIHDIERDDDVTYDEATIQFDQILSAAVERQLVADVPIGIFLSGGLDSSVIAAMAKRQKSDVATFTIKFPQSSFDESAYAEEIAAKIGTRHTTIELSQENCVDGLQSLIHNIDQPFADSSFLPTFLLSKATRQHVTVALGGDGADELLLGYPNFKALRFARLCQSIPQSIGRITGSLAGVMPQSLGYMNAAFLLRQFSYGFGVPANMQSIYWMSAVAAREQDELWIGIESRSLQIAEKVKSQVATSVKQTLAESLQQHFLRHYLPNDILQKTDRASMYNSLEVRTPFLSSAVVNYSLSLPHAMLFRERIGKRILRSVAESYLPMATINRRKHGFALPVSSLIRGSLRDIVEPALLDSANPMYEYLHQGKVLDYWRQHSSLKRDYGKKIWTLFMLAMFFRNSIQ